MDPDLTHYCGMFEGKLTPRRYIYTYKAHIYQIKSNQIKYLFLTRQYKHDGNSENIVHGIITTLSLGKGICGELLSERATERGSKSLFTSGAHL